MRDETHKRSSQCARDSRMRALAGWFARSWRHVGIGLLALLILGAMLDPLLYAVGYSEVASRIFSLYRLICGQVPSHSYYLLGYQLALCSRNLAIYTSLLGGAIAYNWIEPRIPPLDWKLWLLTMAPMALDGGTQFFGLRESDWELRTLTGAIFGLGARWFILSQTRGTSSAGHNPRGSRASRIANPVRAILREGMRDASA